MTGNSRHDRTVSRTSSRPVRRKRLEAHLRVVYPNDMAMVIPLGSEQTLLGRNPESEETPRIRHETVSRKHFSIDWDAVDKQHVGADLGSHNGSWVDGVAAGSGRYPLKNNSIVRLGDVLLVYESGPGLSAQEPPAVSREAIPGEAATTRLLRGAIARAARDPSPALLIGETGTGKELISGEMHRLSGRPGKLLAVNCAALSPQLIESQLFGHERGAFTGADTAQPGLFRTANGGTLFLDEIGEMPLELQPKLLRAIQEGEVYPVGSSHGIRVDVRVVAATNRDLAALTESGQFRRDLYARLALWEIRVPALRERRADILAWVARLHRRWLDERGIQSGELLAFEPDSAEALLLHEWSENLRGLDRLVHQLAAEGGVRRTVTLGQLPDWMNDTDKEAADAGPGSMSASSSSASGDGDSSRRPPPTREELEAVLEQNGGSVRATAKYYGRDRRQIYRWMEAFGLKEKQRPTRG